MSGEESGGIEHDTPSRQSCLSTGESDKDSESDSEISDGNAREDFVGYEDTESLPSSDGENFTSEEEEEEEEEVRGRRYVRARSHRSGRRVYGGYWRIRRRSGRASSSRSESPIGTVREGGEEDEWTEDNALPTMHPFTAVPGMTCPMSTTPLGFFRMFIPFELPVFYGRNE